MNSRGQIASIMGTIILILAGVLAAAENESTTQLRRASEASRLWYAQPATDWSEALPIGNGRLGAMVFGGIKHERLQLNEDTLWSGGPHCYDNPEAHQHLATVREFLERGEYAEAEATAENMLGIPKYQQAYMPLGDLFLDFPKGDRFIWINDLLPLAPDERCCAESRKSKSENTKSKK